MSCTVFCDFIILLNFFSQNVLNLVLGEIVASLSAEWRE